MRSVSGSVNIFFKIFRFPRFDHCRLAPMCPSEPPIIGGFRGTSTPRFEGFRIRPGRQRLRGGRIMGGETRFGKGLIEIILCFATEPKHGKGFGFAMVHNPPILQLARSTF